ncbi:hypothetical protein [Brevibacillus migulae]|uniref:hypothetical protein n=1 Tax=Brevibacillus migulae TaxID=1644114 RepID=UPI00106E7F42|nr:hypothetical protein [Brevibacillus migulae]
MPVNEESRTNGAATYHQFSWNDIYTKDTPGRFAESGLYYVQIVAHGDQKEKYPINIPITVANTILNEEYDIQYLIEQYNKEILSSDIRRVQEGLTDMEFYEGPIDGRYNEDFLLSVIAFEVVLNRSVHVGLNTSWNDTAEPLGEKGKITPQLLHYVNVSVANNRDK